MKYLITTVLLLTGCASAHVIEFDNQKRTVAVRINKFADETYAKKQADQFCNSDAKLLGMQTQTIGAETQYAYGMAASSNVEQRVFHYSCGDELRLPSSEVKQSHSP